MAVRIAFLTDNNVPDSVVVFLRDRGHDVLRSRDCLTADAPDPIVATAAMEADRILISWDKDFNHPRFSKPRFKRLSRIGMSCPEHEGRARIEENIDRIEFEYQRAKGEPLLIRIARDKFQVRG